MRILSEGSPFSIKGVSIFKNHNFLILIFAEPGSNAKSSQKTFNLNRTSLGHVDRGVSMPCADVSGTGYSVLLTENLPLGWPNCTYTQHFHAAGSLWGMQRLRTSHTRRCAPIDRNSYVHGAFTGERCDTGFVDKFRFPPC